MRDKIDGFQAQAMGPGFGGMPQVAASRPAALRWLREFIGYTASAVAGLALDAALLVWLVDVLGVAVLPAAALSFTAGALLVYALAVRIAFHRHKVRDGRIELVVFVAVGCGGLLVTLGVMAAGTQWLDLDYRLCKLAAAGGSFLFNFAVRKALLF